LFEKFKIQHDAGCAHCHCNPKAKAPLTEKPKIERTPSTEKLLPMLAARVGIPEECLVCISRVCVRFDLRNFPEKQPHKQTCKRLNRFLQNTKKKLTPLRAKQAMMVMFFYRMAFAASFTWHFFFWKKM
jgi:hypothetical protein